MGQYSSSAMLGGDRLGLASCLISMRKDPADELEQALAFFSELSPIVTVPINPNVVQTEQAMDQLRQQIAATLRASKPGLYAAYQLGLHLGLAIGQSGVPEPFSWPNAVAECQRAIQQAQLDLDDPTLKFLSIAQVKHDLSAIAAAMDPQQRSSQVQATAKLTNVMETLNRTIANTQAIV
jgi:hypothetical protein